MANEYDEGKVTDREKLAAKRQTKIAERNAKNTVNQLGNQLKTYDVADKQNRALADTEIKQDRRNAEAERFGAFRDLRNAALGLSGSMGNAWNSSSAGNYMNMMKDRNDADNMTYWTQLQKDINTVNNAYQESANQNQIARMDARSNADKALADIQTDLSANLSNINPNLYKSPGANKAIAKMRKANNARLNGGKVISHASAGTGTRASDYGDVRKVKGIQPLSPKMSGYLMPAVAEQATTPKVNKLSGNDYYSQLVNGFNGRSTIV